MQKITTHKSGGVGYDFISATLERFMFFVNQTIYTNLKLKFNTDSAGDASVVGMFDFLELGYIIAKVNHFL